MIGRTVGHYRILERLGDYQGRLTVVDTTAGIEKRMAAACCDAHDHAGGRATLAGCDPSAA